MSKANVDKTLKPIGIFDSGVGGLTVARAITEILPNESMLYFGDTARAPWGDKSAETIKNYSFQICDFLMERGCKIILIACNTASTTDYEAIKNHVGGEIQVVDVVEPLVRYLKETYSGKKLGLIGTKQTVRSNAYQKKLDLLNANVQISSLATPLLVPLIEEGYSNKKIMNDFIGEYLSRAQLQNIEALVLACTHYPLIKQHIENYYHSQVTVIDPSKIVAQTLKEILEKNHLLNGHQNPEKLFFVSDHTQTSTELTKLFFAKEIKLQQHNLT